MVAESLYANSALVFVGTAK